MKKKYKSARLGIDWFTVTYKSLIIWSIVICIILVVGGYFIYTNFYAKEDLSRVALKEISKAEDLINKIRKWEPKREDLVEEPMNLVVQARDNHRQRKFEESIALARESQSLSSQTLKELEAEESSERQAYFTALEGDVRMRPRGEVEWLPSKIRMTLKPGDMVKTGVSSSAQIMFFDGTTYVIEANSLIVIQESFEDPFSNERRVSVKLDSGKVDLSSPRKNVPTSASAITSSTTRAVLGETSRAAMSFEPQLKETVLEVYNGSAEVSTRKDKLTVGSLEKVTIDDKHRLASRGKLIPSPQLIVPVYDRQFIDKDPEKLNITFTWEEVFEAAEYTLQISKSSLF
ncbi:MAG: FecR family protein, partial [Candidatus Aminicenantes bacterium]|nr:FecR family protein [Candidatus Aminicenantes bacterium]